MMKQNRSTLFIGWQGVILALAVVLYGLLEPAYCQGPTSTEWQPRTDGTVLLLQQTPLQGGKISPGVGVHQFDLYAEVTLTAVPKPSYYFVYWIGDVSEPTAISTIVYLDAPKIVIAVFERSEYEFTLEDKRVQNTLGGGGGRPYPSAADYSRQGYSGGGAKRPSKLHLPLQPQIGKPPGPEEVSDKFPVPDRPDKFPVPELPEPATLVLLGTASIWVFTRKKH